MPEDNEIQPQAKSVIKEGLQPRELKYGEGENQRVWELDYKGVKIGINLGDIASSPTEAIMCPTTPWLEVGGGGVENRIANVAGDELFGTYTKRLIDLLTNIRSDDYDMSISAAEQLSKFLHKNTGMQIEKSPEEVRSDILQATRIDELGGDIGEHVAVFYGGSVPAPSGKELGKKGIKVVVLTNVTPEGRNMTSDDMAMFTQSATQAASLTNTDSLTVPAVGTGFAATFGFGLSQADSIGGFFKGAKKYIDQNEGKTNLKRIDYNIYARPSLDAAKQVSSMLESTGSLNCFLSSK